MEVDQTDCCSIYTTSSSGRKWKTPDEIMKLRKKRSLNTMKKTLEKGAAIATLKKEISQSSLLKVYLILLNWARVYSVHLGN